MTGGKYGYAYDFYNYVLKKRGFDIYQLDFNEPASRVRYLLRLFFKKYDLIVSWEISRAIIPILTKHIYGWKGKLKHAKLITMFTRDCGEEFSGHDLGLNDKDFWAILLSIFNSDVITWNYDCFEEFQTYFPKFPKERFFVVHGGVDTNIYKLGDKTAYTQSILTISHWFRPRKCLEALISAMEFLPDWHLFIGGTFLQKDYEEFCHALAKQFSSRIHFLGFVDKTYWMSRIPIFTVPSRCETGNESFVEAMACGCKVLRVEGAGDDEFLTKEQILPRNFSPKLLAEQILSISENDCLPLDNVEVAKRYSWENIEKEFDVIAHLCPNLFHL